MIKIIVASVVVILIHSNGFSQTVNNKAFNDFTNDSEFSAFNEEMILNIKGDSIAGYAFIANGGKPKETVIMVHGLPGNDNQFDIAQSIRRTGRNVIHFNYRGSWGSQGDFLYSSSLEDIDEVIKYLSNAENHKRLRIDTNAFVILGRSYGGGIALIQGSKNERVKKIIAISSMNAGSRFNPIRDLSELSRWKNYLDRQVMLNVNPNTFLQEMLDNKEKYNVVTYKNHLKKKKVLLIEDTENNQSWINLLENIDYKLIKSDHSFISNRIELTNVLIEWLKNN
ncbi:alpha/beta fold hydrolase, partial [Caldithrix abyssi]|nr:alpha/beta fold hydrolase [Caldithrix abyssi]